MHPLLQLAAIAVVGWLPGAALFRVPWLQREKRAQLDAEERAFWAVILSVALSLAVTLVLAASQRYSFERLLLVDLLITAGAAATWRQGLAMPEARRLTWHAALPVALVLLCGARFFPPAEYVLGGKDPGVYMSEGIQIAQRGTLVVHDPVVAVVPPFARDLFVPRYTDYHGAARTDYYSTRFMGFFVQNPESGAVVGQFPHLFPASIAIAYGIDGLTGARRATGVWALLGVLALYFAGARIFGRATAAAAATLLALHVVQVWFARYPNSEVVMQAMGFAMLLAFARAHVDDDPFFAPVAGGLLGLMLFLRFDVVLLVAAAGVASILLTLTGRPVSRAFLLPLFVLGAAAAAYLLGPMRAYVDSYIVFLSNLKSWQYAALVVSGVAAAWMLVAGARRPRVPDVVQRYFPLVLSLLLIAAALYALFFRHPAGRLAAHDAYALRTFTDVYATMPAVLAALIGFTLLARTRFWRDPGLFITVALFSLFLFYKIRIIPEHFWMARRFVPAILPGVLLFAAAAAFATAAGNWRAKALRLGAGGVLIVLLGLHYARVSAPVLAHTEYEGLIPHLEKLAGEFTNKDLVIMEGREAGSDIHILATPLAMIYARNVLLLPPARPDKATFAAFIAWARSRYPNVYFVGSGGTDLLSHSYGVRSIASERFQVPEFETTREGLPRTVRQKEFEYGVYRFGDPLSFPGAWFDLDVGVADDLHVLRFHAKESAEGRTFRWTGATSYIAVTTMPERSRELTLVASDGGRPDAAPPARVEVFLHNQRLGEAVMIGGYRPYTFAIPPDLASRGAASQQPVELRLVTTTWNPAQVLGTPDDRDLGVMLDRVTIK